MNKGSQYEEKRNRSSIYEQMLFAQDSALMEYIELSPRRSGHYVKWEKGSEDEQIDTDSDLTRSFFSWKWKTFLKDERTFWKWCIYFEIAQPF